MSKFEVQYTELPGIRTKVQGVGANLSDAAKRLRAQTSRLSGQRGLGIENVLSGVITQSLAVSALSAKAYATASFISELQNSATESEDAAYRLLAGAAPKEETAAGLAASSMVSSAALWAQLLKIGWTAMSLTGVVASWVSQIFGGEKKSRGYTLRTTTITEGGNPKTIYERVHDDGRVETISEFAYTREASGETYSRSWGKRSDTISTLDYAIIANLANKTSKEASRYIEESFSMDHPFRNARCVDWTNDPLTGLTAATYQIDSDHAIVVFGGTDGFMDGVADAGIVLTGLPGIGELANAANSMNPQVHAANAYISNLKYSNVMVTGHSLGGYLAADVTLRNEKISECYTFNAPGRSALDALGNSIFNSSNADKITNVNARQDNVHNIGFQPGTSRTVDVGPDASRMGLLGAHDLPDIIATEAATHYRGSGDGGGGGGGGR